MIRAVLFDLDGTLSNRAAAVRALLDEQYQTFSADLPSIARDAFIGRILQLDAHGHGDKTAVYRQVATDFDLPTTTVDVLREQSLRLPTTSLIHSTNSCRSLIDCSRRLPNERCTRPSNMGVRRPFSPIGHAVNEPLDDRVESLLIESVSAIDTQLGDEIAGDLGHDLVGIP